MITLEQKREKGDKGFGFTLKGGHEKGEPVLVESVVPGKALRPSAACFVVEIQARFPF